MKRSWLLLMFAFVATVASAQHEMSAFTTTGRVGVATPFVSDYYAIGINPANLGWRADRKVSVGLAEFSSAVYSEGFDKEKLNRFIFGGEEEALTRAEQKELAKKFASANNAFNIDVNAFAAAVQLEKLGGLAFSVRERVGGSLHLNNTLSEIIFLGYNASYFDSIVVKDGDTMGYATVHSRKALSELAEGSRITAFWLREYNVSYGRRITKVDDIEIYAGIGLKYVQGFANMDIRTRNGRLSAFGALSESIDVGLPEVRPLSDRTLEPVGKGFGIDLGVSLIIQEKIHFGAAINNIGSIKWEGTLIESKDTVLVRYGAGRLTSEDVFTGMDTIPEGENAFLRWSHKDDKKAPLGTNIRLGLGYTLNEKIRFGFDAFIPLVSSSNAFENPTISLGADLKPVKWFRLSTGMSMGGVYGFNVPIGLTFFVKDGLWEAGVASHDAVTFFTSENPMLSMAVGLLRFRFGRNGEN